MAKIIMGMNIGVKLMLKTVLFRVARFFLFNTPKRRKIYHIATKLPNGRKIYQMAAIYAEWL
jgi:hypothetical protein